MTMGGTNKRLDVGDVLELKTSVAFIKDKFEEMRMGHKEIEKR